MRPFLLIFILLLFPLPVTAAPLTGVRPNVILVITDDQGYGDLAAHGNPVIQTPNMDTLHSQSVRFTQFHVDPTCSPTRSALLTGRYATRVGIWHTVFGRSILPKNEVVMPQLFAEAGYTTGMFGKWHLGDNYPFRPHDRGFQETFYHLGGGVTQSPDYWGNDYFDDTYYRNGQPEKTAGYCTDVWFANAIDFVKRHKDAPFFLYIATNAPHEPLNVAEKDWKPYAKKGLPEPLARFYGMISNIDENLGKLENVLQETGLAENTIFIFMTDNGSAANGFNAGMRGKKGTPYEGGHRVPFFVRWPSGPFGKNRDIGTLTAHIDVLPTLIEVCGLTKPDVAFDGTSLLPLLTSETPPENWPDRSIGIEVNREGIPRPWVRSVLMTQKWRLVNGDELYDIEADPGQQNNLAPKKPDILAEMRRRYMDRWPSVVEGARNRVKIPIGDSAEPKVRLCAHDWDGDRVPPYLGHVADWVSNGRWSVDVAQTGKYRFRLRHFPEESNLPFHATRATLNVGDQRWEQAIPNGGVVPIQEVIFEVELPKGETWIEAQIDDEPHGLYRGAYYVYIEKICILSGYHP